MFHCIGNLFCSVDETNQLKIIGKDSFAKKDIQYIFNKTVPLLAKTFQTSAQFKTPLTLHLKEDEAGKSKIIYQYHDLYWEYENYKDPLYNGKILIEFIVDCFLIDQLEISSLQIKQIPPWIIEGISYHIFYNQAQRIGWARDILYTPYWMNIEELVHTSNEGAHPELFAIQASIWIDFIQDKQYHYLLDACIESIKTGKEQPLNFSQFETDFRDFVLFGFGVFPKEWKLSEQDWIYQILDIIVINPLTDETPKNKKSISKYIDRYLYEQDEVLLSKIARVKKIEFDALLMRSPKKYHPIMKQLYLCIQYMSQNEKQKAKYYWKQTLNYFAKDLGIIL